MYAINSSDNEICFYEEISFEKFGSSKFEDKVNDMRWEGNLFYASQNDKVLMFDSRKGSNIPQMSWKR